MNFGAMPEYVGEFVTPDCDLMFVLYMPVCIEGVGFAIPAHVSGYRDFVQTCLAIEEKRRKWKYAYLTVKRLFVQPGCLGGRLGWHTDGFGTDDVNYIWCDADPTEFCVQKFNLSDDHELSMMQMEMQAQDNNIIQFDACDIIRIDASHVHRCPENPSPGYRTFARMSFSDSKYDLIGNAHNHDLDYNWIMHPRGGVRNDTSSAIKAAAVPQ